VKISYFASKASYVTDSTSMQMRGAWRILHISKTVLTKMKTELVEEVKLYKTTKRLRDRMSDITEGYDL